MHLSQAIFHTQPQTDKQDRTLLINLTTFKAQDKRIIRDLCKLARDVAKTLAPGVLRARRTGRKKNLYQSNSLGAMVKKFGGKKLLFSRDKDIFPVFILFFP